MPKRLKGITINKDGSNQDSLRITDVEVKEGNTLIYRFSAPRKLKRYLHSDSFYVKYDRRVEDVPRSILYIPGVAGLITLCWAKNTDIHVEELDSRYQRSMMAVRGVLNDFYPEIGFHGDVIADQEVVNSFGNSGTGQLFSGGVDSTALYIENRKLEPTLYSIIGGVIPVDNEDFIDLFKRTYSEFAEREGVKIHFIETDIRSVLNEALLWSEYRDQLRKPWWEDVNQGIVYLGLCSPLTLNGVGRVLIAASGSPESAKPYGTHPLIDNKIGWADVEVIHSQREYYRQEKISRFIKKFIEEEEIYPDLFICNYSPLFSDELNCKRCRRCSRTAIRLLLEGIDPTECGFDAGEELYKHIKEEIIPNDHRISAWKDIQKYINFKETRYLNNSEEFLRWLKDAELEALNKPEKMVDLEDVLLPIQARLPRVLQEKILRTYYKWRYNG